MCAPEALKARRRFFCASGGPLQADLGHSQVQEAPPVVWDHVHDRLVAEFCGLKLGCLPVVVPQVEVRLQVSQ